MTIPTFGGLANAIIPGTGHFSLDREFGVYGLAGSWHGQAVHTERVWAVALGGCVAAAGAGLLYHCGPDAAWLPGCLFHRWTELWCPGCGMTRATYEVLHCRPGQALRFNPVGVVLLPVALLGLGLLGLGLEAGGWMRGHPLAVRLRIGGRGAWWLFGLLLVFWLLRNIPVWPLTLLAPP